jgi:hypothetical protein
MTETKHTETKHTETKPRKKTGPKPRLPVSEHLHAWIPEHHRAVLDAYSDQEQISLAAALRKAIELLQEKHSL